MQFPIKDFRIEAATVFRFMCTDCGRAFRHYPQGVDRRDRSQRLRAFAALSCALGLSLGSATHTLTALSGLARSAPSRVRVIGADETFMKLRGEKAAVGFVADAESGQLLGMGVMTSQDSTAFVEWLSGYVSKFGVE